MTRITPEQARRLIRATQRSFGTTGTDGPESGTEVTIPPPRPRATMAGMAYLEDQEQITLIGWVNEYRAAVPALKWLWHAANGEYRDQVTRYDRRTGGSYQFSPTGAKLKRMGVLPGIADIQLDYPVPRDPGDAGPDGSGYYHGAKIELKRVGGDSPDGAQAEYLRDMHAAGYFVAVCYGAVEAWEALQEYLWLDMPLAIVPAPAARSGPAERRKELSFARPKTQRAARPRTSAKKRPLQLEAFGDLP